MHEILASLSSRGSVVISPDSVHIIGTPQEFYEQLMVNVFFVSIEDLR